MTDLGIKSKVSHWVTFIILCLLSFVDISAQSGSTGEVNWSYDSSKKTLTISGNGAMANYTGYKKTPWYNSGCYNNAISIIVEEGVTKIGDYSFNKFAKCTTVSLPSTLIEIGEGAFMADANNTTSWALKSILIPASVTKIGKAAFKCIGGSFTSVKFADSSALSLIGESAFQGCNAITSLELPAKLKSVGTNGLYIKNSSLAIVFHSLPTFGTKALYNTKYASAKFLLRLDDNPFVATTNTYNFWPANKNASFIDEFTIIPKYVDGYAAIALPFNVEEIPNGLTSYEFALTRDDALLFSEVTSMKVGVPYIVKSNKTDGISVVNPTLSLTSKTVSKVEWNMNSVFQSVAKDSIFVVQGTKAVKLDSACVIPAFCSYLVYGGIKKKQEISIEYLADKPKELIGDVNGDGVVDVADITLIAKIILGK